MALPPSPRPPPEPPRVHKQIFIVPLSPVPDQGTRDHGSNHHSDLAVCLCCWVDAVTGGASKPGDLWYYSIKYDDGEEEHKVGPARIFAAES